MILCTALVGLLAQTMEKVNRLRKDRALTLTWVEAAEQASVNSRKH